MNRRDGSIYLERIELSNFRAYGESFTLDLPDGPGVTLVYGQNGLGKTTLFDGVEWCLTGAISRFTRYLQSAASRRVQYLTRLGAPVGSHRVTLSFTGIEPIDRGRGFDPAAADVAQLLRRPEWPDVSDLSRYLSITHFLGQSAAQRFSVKEPPEQWEALKGPAGIDRVNQIKDRLGGNATRQAFTRYLNQSQLALSAARQALADWNALVERYNRLRSLSKSAEALPPAAVLELCVETIRTLSTLEFQPEVAISPADAPEAALEQVQLAVRTTRQRLDADSARVRALDDLVEELATLREEERVSVELATAAEHRRVTANTEMAHADDALAQATLNLNGALQVKTGAEMRLQVVARVGESITILGEASTRVAAIESELPNILTKIAAADARTTELAQEIEKIEQRSGHRQGLAERVRRLRTAIPVMHELESLVTRIREQSHEDDGERKLAELHERRAVLESDERACNASIAESEAQLDAHDRRNALIAASVAQIAASLSDADLECPVCLTQFGHGQLVELLRSGRERPVGSARDMGETLAERRLELAAITSALEDLDDRRRALIERMRMLQSSKDKELELRRQVAELTSGQSANSVDELQALAFAAESDLAALDIEISAAPTDDDLRSEALTLDVTRTADVSRVTRLRNERAEVLAQQEKARATLEQYPELWTEESGLTQSLDELRSGAAERVAAATTALQACDAVVNSLREQLEVRRREAVEITAVRDTHRKRQSELAARQSELIGTWLSLKMSGEPDAAAVWQERDRLDDALRMVEKVQDQLERAHDRYRSWLEDEQLAECQRQVQQLMVAAGVNDEREMSDHLGGAVADAEVALSRAARTKEKADEVVRNLKDLATTYAHDVLQPLNDSIQDFATALLTRADGSLRYQAVHHVNRSELRSGLVRSDAFGRAEQLDMNPNLFFSEGQLSALSVSALLAASTNFRWSRWPALLMDDPIQHNDVIHASAFIDLLRRLVSQLDYQVILSSHDASEADFIARKCRSGGIRYALCELVPSGESGIVSARV